MKVLKFGGTSLETPERVSGVIDLIEAARRDGPIVVVVSAWAGVTDDLTRAAHKSIGGIDTAESICDEIEARHRRGVESLAGDTDRNELLERIGASLAELRERFRGISMVGEYSPRVLDGILSHGERLSAAIVAAGLRHRGVAAALCDARELIVTDDRFGDARVDTGESYRRIAERIAGTDAVAVITGFTGATRSGDTTTLGRGGSDLTASLVGAAVGAESIELWTDVDGVMSADPRQVPGAFPLENLSYEELMEMSHFGARVVYPASIHPARAAGIPISIRNTLHPSFAGTRIDREPGTDRHPIRGISSIPRVALLRLEGDGMIGVPGIASRLFGALARQRLNVILIGQASSEHSICFALPPDAVERARSEIEAEFALERQAGLIEDLVIETQLAVIAAVGHQMRQRPGIAGRLFTVLGDRSINIHAIAQGSSELNISLVVAGRDEAAALNAIHDAFFAAPAVGCRVYVVGTGRVGGALLDQLQNGSGRSGAGCLVAGILNRRRMVTGPNAGDDWRRTIESGGGETAAADRFFDIVTTASGPRVLVDCTAGDQVPARYQRLLQAGVAVVTANKRPLAGRGGDWRRLFEAAAAGQVPLLFETTVGAGLPVIRTLADLVRTGDRVRRVEGILSGTAAFLLDRLRAGEPFHQALRTAHQLGYTEPDPRDDLAGADVGRKLLILARVAGFEMEPEQIEVEPLVPAEYLEGDGPERLWERAAELDAPFADRQRRCVEAGKRLCYLARIEPDHATVGLTEIGADHPATAASGTDNLVAFTTDRYAESPLVVGGPGAGPQVTAAGLFADILAAADRLGRR